jgi:hypothetical protein
VQRRVARFLIVALATAWVALAAAAPRDKAAEEKINEAINKHYLATEFDKAEGILKGTLDACDDRCSPNVKARVWMYIGIIRGSGRQNVSAAQEAFQQALALDPKVTLDDALATPETRNAFTSAAAALGQTAPAASTPSSAGLSDDDMEGDMECTPTVKEVETSRPIPVACTTDEPAGKVQLRYKVFGGDTWVSVNMTRKGAYWTGEIPCSDTGITGKLRWFVRALDASGDAVDSYGSKKTPAEINLVQSSDEDPPKLPGQAAPPRCMDAAACPEDMIGTPACPGTGGKGGRGNKGWGAPCDTSMECEEGLICLQGDMGRSCESAPSCDTDSDCPDAHICRAGSCDIGDEGGGGPAGPYKKNWFGLHFSPDLVWLSGSDVCSLESQQNAGWSCFYGGGQQLTNLTPEGGGGEIGGGMALGSMRILASYERAFTPNIGAEARVGFAFNGGPTPVNGNAFLPIHAEVRGKYWFGRNVYSKKGLRPYAHLGLGAAQVDAKITVRVRDCLDDLTCQTHVEGQPDAYRKLGLMFVTAGGGAAWAIGENHGPVLNLNLTYMLPSSGVVIQPSIGYMYGL